MYSSVWTICIAFFSIALLLFLILKLKIQEVFALLIVSVVAGLAVGMPPSDLFDTIEKGMGDTLGFLAVVIGIGSMFGEVLKVTGGAQNLADTLFKKFGEHKVIWALGFLGMLVAIPIYMEVAFVIFAPIIYSFCRKSEKSLLYFSMPFLAGVVISYSTIPPAAGAMTGVAGLGAEVGLVILFSFLAGIPAMLVGGPIYGTFISKRIRIEVPAEYDEDIKQEKAEEKGIQKQQYKKPSFGSVVLIFILPLLLMIGKSIGDLALEEGSTLRNILTLVGHPFGALMIVCGLAIYAFGIRGGFTKQDMSAVTGKALAPAGMIILIAGAGGAFGEVLVTSGVGDVIAEYANLVGLPMLVLAYITAFFIRIAQGSGTVAIITTSTLMAPITQAMGTECSTAMKALMVSIIGFGAITASHLNDSGYWLVKRYFNMNEIQTLKTYTMQTTIISVVGFMICMIISIFI